MRPIPAIDEIHVILFNEKSAKKFLYDKKIIRQFMVCEICGATVAANLIRETFRHRCKDWTQVEVSIWKYSFFFHTHIPPHHVPRLSYLWLCGCSHTVLENITGHSNTTITAFMRHFRQLLENSIPESACVIGGTDVVVEIDECKVAKRKFNRGHFVEGAWVVGGVERTDQRKVFMVEVQNRDAYTLADIITTHVAPGSIIHTDCWKGYSFLSNIDEITHKTVNHSRFFKDPDTGVHSNTIEGTWEKVKSSISKRYRCSGALENHLMCFIWKYSTVNHSGSHSYET
jgi:transposase-like protein